ncbi:TPM domain-containing protein [Methylocella sp.]|uniref:TPM domain-containing protein n=1 Tax=Methylocella sp. TaxID=1978226 RepID=UPI00378386F3
MTFTVEEQQRVNAAIAEAEKTTDGEIVCVLARASSDYLAYAVAWAALTALAVPWPLLAFTQLSVQQILLAQIVVFAGLYLALSRSGVGCRLVPKPVRLEHAHRAALEQFVTRGLARRRNHAAVLIFVSLAEHYVRVVADDGVAVKVDKRVWQGAVDALLAAIKSGDLAGGYVEAVKRCGVVLAEHFPAGSGGAELPDKIYVI